MSTQTEKQSRFQTLRAKLPDLQRRIVTEMSLVFGSSSHDLWSGEIYHASPYEIDELEKIRNKNLDDLTNSEVDSLMFSVITTLGSAQTLRFLLPRFYAAYLSDPDYGWISEPWLVIQKLCNADFDNWPDSERKPVLEAVILTAQLEIDRWTDYDTAPDDDTETLKWAQARLKEIS